MAWQLQLGQPSTQRAPYEVENVDVEGLAVYTNNPVFGAMRGLGVPQVAFAHESQMDLLAAKLGLDLLEIRRRSAMRCGSRNRYWSAPWG